MIETAEYEKIANDARIKVLELIYKAQTSHIGSNLGSLDILTVIYGNSDFEKDKLIVSKGWVAASIYVLAAHHNLIPKEDLNKYCIDGSRYIGLLEPLGFFGAEFAGGSMQMGTAASVGLALAKKINKESGKVFVLESDGAMAGGMIWESAAIAAHHKLDNLIIIFDINDWQATGKTCEVLDMRPCCKKLEAFGWHVTEIDGHDYRQVEKAINKKTNKPHCILARTKKGKGISFMEADGLKWHYKNIDKENYEKALAELC